MPLADDHDPVGTCHATEPGQRLLPVRPVEQLGELFHTSVLQQNGPPRLSGTAHSKCLHVLVSDRVYQTPREKKPSSASTRMTIRMIQRIPI